MPAGGSGNDFWTSGTGTANSIPKFWEREFKKKISFLIFGNYKFHSEIGNGNGIENSIPNFQEQECKWKIPFPIFGNGNASGKFHFRERELEAAIPAHPCLPVFELREYSGHKLGAKGREKAILILADNSQSAGCRVVDLSI